MCVCVLARSSMTGDLSKGFRLFARTRSDAGTPWTPELPRVAEVAWMLGSQSSHNGLSIPCAEHFGAQSSYNGLYIP